VTRLREVEGPSGWHVEDQLEYLDAPEWMRECAPHRALYREYQRRAISVIGAQKLIHIRAGGHAGGVLLRPVTSLTQPYTACPRLDESQRPSAPVRQVLVAQALDALEPLTAFPQLAPQEVPLAESVRL
jgi:hypothetical protein